ncbi:MAG: hypothetical protein A3A94_01280 [Candidatus Portnoybacteria bacterium RIFCSPLOWO2_01_FULL_43_11]|uniref:Cell envelope-related transcriptional attenuator domain-containing protein n=2 Tax=Candidatus Portnoyibacteriota TaxID=1817913 RepID=A0A1G2FKV2_9BACT|nr:MAG: hypothetical protein A3E90_02945 [Candidatus Portnoybacteria bacterium RIFCSPHIGHO2_12_FULL_40_11]OGZ38949.1 MAG: hypothetical protein A3A94_01280 [Candidatus Portnoybacteria bacterium RIFCSPLOWO2_01_FULL_43_11]
MENELQLQPIQPKKKRWIWLWIPILLLTGFFGLFFFKTSFTVSQMMNWDEETQALPFAGSLPDKDPDRINILLLGFRGTGQDDTGDLLTDAIILISIKKSTGQIALVSVPRDLYVQIPGLDGKKKINFAYAHAGLDFSKAVISHILDIHIDHAAAGNFKALEETVNELGGISIYLDKPFEESFQWAKEGLEEEKYWFKKEIQGEEKWVFYVPVGQNALDGKTALYYARSRFSTNDFDRMHRQQQILTAVKDKALSLGVLTNPIKIYNLLDILGKNIRTDMDLDDIKELISLASDLDTREIIKKSFDTNPEGLLYQTFINDEYVLLPVGDNFDKIQEQVKNIFK